MAQHLGWLGSHNADLAWRYNDAYPGISIYMGDDVYIHLLATGRDKTTILTSTGYKRVLTDLTGAEVVCTINAASPPYTRALTKTQATSGPHAGITIVPDPIEGINAVAIIHLTAAETAALTDLSYVIACKAKLPDNTVITLASTNLYLNNTRILNTEFEA